MTDLMDASQVAAMLKCSERTAEDYARAGRLPAVKFGEGWIFPADALLRAINRMAEEEAEQRARPAPMAAVKRPLVRKGPPNLAVLS